MIRNIRFKKRKDKYCGRFCRFFRPSSAPDVTVTGDGRPHKAMLCSCRVGCHAPTPAKQGAVWRDRHGRMVPGPPRSRARLGSARLGSARLGSARPDPTRPDPTRPDPTRPDPTRPGPARPGSTRSGWLSSKVVMFSGPEKQN